MASDGLINVVISKCRKTVKANATGIQFLWLQKRNVNESTERIKKELKLSYSFEVFDVKTDTLGVGCTLHRSD